jgi:hypothetical protein
MADVQATSEATPVADHVHDHGLYVGNGHHVTGEMVEQLADTIRQEIKQI